MQVSGWVLLVVGLALAVFGKGFPDWRFTVCGFLSCSVGSLLLLKPWQKPTKPE